MSPVEHMIQYFHLEPHLHLSKDTLVSIFYGLYYLAVTDIGTPSKK